MYLKSEEIPTYCPVAEVTPTDVMIASGLIDAYLGRTFAPKKFTDRVRLNAKLRGKLKHPPVIVVEKVMVNSPTPFGSSLKECKVEDIILDPEGDGYFTYVGYGFNFIIFGSKPSEMEVTYLSGYMEYPEVLKVACGMLACNVHQAQSFQGAKELTSMDFSVKMTDDSFFTSDIRMLLRGLEHAGTL